MDKAKAATTPSNLGAQLSAEVSALLRARNALLWVVSPEEGRVERSIIEAAATAKYETRLWDCIGGVTDATGAEVQPGRSAQDPAAVLAAIRDSRERAVWVLRDLPPWLKDPTVCRAVRSLARSLPSQPREQARAIVILSPTADIPPELSDHAVIVKWKLPDRGEIASIFDRVMSVLPAEEQAAPEVREAAIEAAVGLSAEASAACYSKSLVTQGRRIVPALIAAEKRRVVNQERGIEWFEPDPRGLAAVGGLDNLKTWLSARRSAFTQRAREFGLPLPRGMLLVGLPGGGKSLTAKAVATAWGVPLLRLDLGGARSKWVGESESNIRSSLGVAEAVGNCVLWIDEIEKALGGATGGAADGGVSSDALGTLLSWMQERKGSVFVVATANDVRSLPPELLRKGRFDEVFWVDLPNQGEREAILRVTLEQYRREPEGIAIDKVAAACDGFVGAEIAALVPAALFQAFENGERAINTADLLAEARNTVPLSKTASDKIAGLREWAKGRARRASAEETTEQNDKRNLDL